MEITQGIRPWVCALPQPGWGGSTLAGYIVGIGLRPDANGSDEEIEQVLNGLVTAGYARAVEVGEGEDARWELTEEGHDALIAPIKPVEGAPVEDVLLELEPGIAMTSAEAQ
jgi:hypothetical protein